MKRKQCIATTYILLTTLVTSCNSSNDNKDINISLPSSSPQLAKEKSNLLPILSNQNTPIVPEWNKVNGKSQLPTLLIQRNSNTGIFYRPDKKPIFQSSDRLNKVITKVIELVKKEKLSEDNLSITLIDASSSEIAEFNKGKLTFPASIAKMFWLVALQGQIEAGMWKSPELFDPYIDRMMRESDNDSSSFIIDNITGSYSSEQKNNDRDIDVWLSQRKLRINSYFIASEYDVGTNLTQKTYPIPYLNLSEPKGNELQIRHNSKQPEKLVRNAITSFDSARLLYEICYKKEAVSKKASEKMCPLFKRDVDKNKWSKIKAEDFNPVQSFLGESLPSKNVQFYSKAGWTPKSRSEVSLVEVVDKKKVYVLSIFADNPSFGNSKIIFPLISKLVYDEMNVTLGK
jgi:hypothetical protein